MFISRALDDFLLLVGADPTPDLFFPVTDEISFGSTRGIILDVIRWCAHHKVEEGRVVLEEPLDISLERNERWRDKCIQMFHVCPTLECVFSCTNGNISFSPALSEKEKAYIVMYFAEEFNPIPML